MRVFKELLDQIRGPPPLPDDAAGYGLYAKGMHAVSDEDWAGAMRLFNTSLVLHRRSLGPDDEACGRTLHQIGVCLMRMKDHYAALLAFEEAIYIRQLHYGDGDEGAAEIANSMWTFLHKTRLDIDGVPDRIDVLKNMKKQKSVGELQSFLFSQNASSQAPRGGRRGGLQRVHDGEEEVMLVTKSTRRFGSEHNTRRLSSKQDIVEEDEYEEEGGDTRSSPEAVAA